MTEPETPKHSRRRRAIVIAAVVTGASILLADSAGFRTTVRESLTEIGVAPPVANFAYFLGGALCFGIIFQLAFMWLTSREVLVESRRRWWCRKRVIAALVCWFVVAYPVSHLAYLYLNGRNVLPPSASFVASTFFSPLRALVFRPTGGPRPGFGWYQGALHYAYESGREHAGSAAVAPLLAPQQATTSQAP